MTCPNDGKPSRNHKDDGLCPGCWDRNRRRELKALRAGKPCPTCSETHRRADGKPLCFGHTNGRACRRPHMLAMEVCGSHGGRAPRSLQASQNRETERKARIVMQTYGRPIKTTATEALLEEVQWSAGYVAWLRDRVAELDQAELIWGRTKEVEGDVVVGNGPGAALERATTTTEEAKPHIYRQMLLEERKHLVTVCKAAIDAGIEERKVRLAEQQGALVADVIRRILDDLNLTPEQAALVATTVPRHLRLLTA